MAWVLWDQPRNVEPPEEFRQLRNVVRLVWHHFGYNPPSKGQIMLADSIQSALLDPKWPTDTIVQCPRGFGKSVILACAPAWIWSWAPASTFFVTSAEQTKANQFAKMCRGILDRVPEFNHLAPRSSQVDQQDQFEVVGHKGDQAPSMRSLGVFGPWTSQRADFFFGDDIETLRTSETPGMRQKLRNRSGEATHLMTPEGPNRRVWLGTAQNDETFYDFMRAERGAGTLLIPASYPPPDRRAFYETLYVKQVLDELDEDPTLEGTPVDPERLSEEVLEEKRRGTTDADFLRQYEGDTRLADSMDRPFRLRDLIVDDLSPTHGYPVNLWAANQNTQRKDLEDICVGLSGDAYYGPLDRQGALQPYETIATFIDPSGDGIDETGWVTCATLNGYMYVLDIGGDSRGHGEEVLDAICRRALENNSKLLVTEKNYGGGMFKDLVVPRARQAVMDWKLQVGEERRLGVDEMQLSGRKERRIVEALLPLVKAHKIIVDSEAIRRDYSEPLQGSRAERAMEYRWARQFTRITLRPGGCVHDDRLDALAMAAEWFKGLLSKDAEQEEAKKRRKEEIRNSLWMIKTPQQDHAGLVGRALPKGGQSLDHRRPTYWSSRTGPGKN
jgi:hypothetical protein